LSLAQFGEVTGQVIGDLLQRHAADATGRRAMVGDQRHGYAYAELPDAVAGVMAALDEQGVHVDEQVAVECATDARSALLVLALLVRGQRVVLVPASSAQAKGDRALHSPPFCRLRLVAAEVGHGTPGDWLRCEVNAQWNGAPSPGRGAAIMLHTSGTSSEPKLVVFPTDALLRNARACASRFALTQEDRVAIPVALAHMYGLGAAFLPAVLAGAAIELQPRANVITWMARERRFQPTVAFLTPAFCAALVRVRRRPRPYRLTVVAGDRLPAAIFAEYEQLHGPLVSLYGSTELGAIAAGSPDDPPALRRSTCGRLMPNVTAIATSGAITGDNAAAELVISHPAGFCGYADGQGLAVPQAEYRPVTSDKVATSGPGGHRTRDLGVLRADGYLQVLGRLDDQVKRDGRLVALGAVEAGLESLPAVRRAVVLALENTVAAARGRELLACCELESASRQRSEPGHGEQAPTAARELRRASLAVLANHAVPDRFVLIEEWPLLASGKIDRRALAARYGAATVPQDNRDGQD
jgi:acyl-coenzyme A synthetase/AMP-(fatty) acid ligase